MLIKPYVRFAMHHTWLENYYINRSIWDHELIFIESGSMKITINGNEYIVKENDLVIIPPDTPHTIEWNGENCHQPHVHFDFYHLSDSEEVGVSMLKKEDMNEKERKFFRPNFFLENNIEIPYVMSISNPISIKSKLYAIIDEFTFKKDFSDLFLEGSMTELIGIILRENNSKKMANDTIGQLTTLISHMNESVDKNLSLDEIASYASLSKWTLINIFKKYYETSPMKYYNNLRYLRAKDLLQFSLLAINEIGMKMGFNDPQTFSRWFKNIDGNYPNYYRNRIK